jgi:hypothetical protein
LAGTWDTTTPPIDIGTPGSGNWALAAVTLTSTGSSVPALEITGDNSDDTSAEAIIIEYWKNDGVINPVTNPDDPAWIMEGSHPASTTKVDITSIQGGASYYAAVTYVVSGILGDRLVLGPVTVGTLSATVSDGDKGDITVSGSGATYTIDNDVVTYAKMQNVSATSRVLGRKTAGAGDPQELTLSETLDFIGSAAQGDVLYRGASTWARLAAGTSGQFLRTSGAGANPVWAAFTGSGSAAWSLNASWDFAVSGTVAELASGDLTGYSEALVIFSNVTLSVSDLRIVQVSTNGGSSYDTTSGSYISIDDTGVTTNNSGFIAHGTATASARTGTIWMTGLNIGIAAKPALTPNRTLHSVLYVGSSSVINKIRALGASGNMTGGKVWILAR